MTSAATHSHGVGSGSLMHMRAFDSMTGVFRKPQSRRWQWAATGVIGVVVAGGVCLAMAVVGAGNNERAGPRAGGVHDARGSATP